MIQRFWFFFIVVFISPSAFSADISGMLGEMGISPRSPSLSFTGWLEPASSSGDVYQNRLNGSVPVYQGDKDSFSLNAGASDLRFSQQQYFSDNGLAIPRDLQKMDLGASYSHKLENDQMIGGRLSIGSASDQPFTNFDTTTFMLMGFYSYPSDNPNARWAWTVFLSNNNPIANYVPIPGFVYIYRTPTFLGMFGLPVAALQWMPVDPWSFSFSLFGPEISTEISYGLKNHLQEFVAYSWGQQSFLPKDRPDLQARLYFNEMRAYAGLRTPIAKSTNLEVQGGYAFDRALYEGIHTFSKDLGSLWLADSIFAQLNLKIDL